MSENKKVSYTLVYEGGGKTNLETTINMKSGSSSEAERKIRDTNNLTSNVREVRINEIKKG
jgi:hypothetical protein